MNLRGAKGMFSVSDSQTTHPGSIEPGRKNLGALVKETPQKGFSSLASLAPHSLAFLSLLLSQQRELMN